MTVGKLALGELNKSQFGGTCWEARRPMRGSDLNQDAGGRVGEERIQDIQGDIVYGAFL